MKNWKEYKIEDIGIVVGGATPSTKDSSNYDGNIPWITPKDLANHNGRYISHGERMISLQGFNNCSCKMLPKNSILFSSRAPIGYVAIANNELCTNQGFKSIIPNNNIVDSLFLYYLLVYYKPVIENMGSGTTFKEVSGSVMKNLAINIPEIDEQKKIAAILSSLDDKIELNCRINDNLEQQAQALFKSWFVDFEPWQGVMPDDWREGSIYEIVDVIYGAPYKSNLFNEKKEGLPLIRIRDLKDYSPQYYTPEILPNTEFVYMGDVIAGMDAEFIPTLWMGNKGVLNQRCCKFKSKNPKFSNYYIMYLLKPELEFVQSYKTGTTVSHLGKSDIDRFIVVIPSSDVIEDFSRKVEPLLSEKIKTCKEMRILSSLRDTLLPKLMSGELKINDLNR